MSEMHHDAEMFVYHAHGHALSAHFTRPVEHLVEVQAGTSLPSTGGLGMARVENFRFKHYLSFRAAHTTVSGSHNRHDNSHTTLVTSTLEGLSIFDIITADRIVMRISSRYPPGGDEPVFTTFGSHFDNLRIAGCEVKVHVDPVVSTELGTFVEFKKKHDGDPAFRKTVRDRFALGEGVPESLRRRYKGHSGEGLPESKGNLCCSLVEKIETKCPGLQQHGHALLLPGFGKVFLAELHISHSTRRLTMLQVLLGSPQGGGVTGGQGGSNGWPKP